MSTSLLEAKHILQKALALLPTLTANGIETSASFTVSRQEDLQKNLKQIALCADWLALQSRIKSVNSRHSSYGYKHMVEGWTRAKGEHAYISNGAFIAAAVGVGLVYKQVGIRACFNLSNRTVNQYPRI
jgi:hypothetical protein